MNSVAQAATYDVNATVPYPTPTVPADFESGLDGSTVNNALLTVAGSCEVLTPAGVVSVWRSGVSVGSAACNAGNFSLQIMLVSGSNQLVARTANQNGLYGPDSAATTITLQLPDDSSAPGSGGNGTGGSQSGATQPRPSPTDPITPAKKAEASNAAAGSGLTMRPGEPFTILSSKDQSKITVIISGGTAPYRVSLNWGDGRTESRVVDGPGTFYYDANYSKPGTYSLQGQIVDAAGAYAEFNYVIIKQGAVVQASAEPAVEPASPTFLETATPYIAAGTAAVVLVGAATAIGFQMGAGVVQAAQIPHGKPHLPSPSATHHTAKTNRNFRKPWK